MVQTIKTAHQGNVWLLAKIHGHYLGLWPELNNGPVCDSQHRCGSIFVLWRNISEPRPFTFTRLGTCLEKLQHLKMSGRVKLKVREVLVSSLCPVYFSLKTTQVDVGYRTTTSS